MLETNANRLQDLVRTVTLKRQNQSILEQRISGTELTVATTRKNIVEAQTKQEALDNLQIACKLILEKLTLSNKGKLEQFSTYALKTIFTDRDYSVELEIKEDVKNPSLTIMLVENGIKQDVKGSVGGGIITVLGFLFQIYYLEVYGLNKVLFIDEGLKEVSKAGLERDNEDYLNNLLLFLKELSKERHYKFITVTHDDSVRLIADTVYQVRKGEVKELEKRNEENL